MQDWGQSELSELNLEDWTMAELARMLPDTLDIKKFKAELQNRLSVALKAEIIHIDFIANGGKHSSFMLTQHHYSWISTPYYKIKRAIALLTERMSSCPKKASTQLKEISRYARQNGITNFDRDLEALSKEIRDFLHDKKREAFIKIDKISKKTKTLDEQDQIARNREALKTEIKKVTEDFKEDEQDQIARNREALKTEIKKVTEDFKENDVDINIRNSEGETILHLAARIGDKSLVSYLLSEGASFDVQNYQHLTPAGLSRVKEVSDLLISVEVAFSVASDGFSIILLIKHSDDIQVLAKAKNGDGHTLL
ncbi:MAG: hypothetical protein PG981_001385 [Wolbachia endosymbiont of Ctenocephalides orientis wCori]|nr:MAG: hypothetical protein PG981_001385 [Wolbachia endosymbiont of Ctenocephalides orientis wCori]